MTLKYFEIGLIFALIFITWYVLGKAVLEKLVSKDIPKYLFPLFPIVGAAIYTYVALILGLLGLLNVATLTGMVLIIWLLFHKNFSFPKIDIKFTKTEKLLLLIILGFISYYFASSFAPAHRYDELAYHLPEAEYIAQTGRIKFPLLEDNFFGQLPAFMEVLFASGLIVGGLPLAHLFHFCWVFTLIVFVYLYFQKEKQTSAGLIFGLGIFFTTELINYSTSLYVDIAASTFEFIGILLLIDWLKNKDTLPLYLSSFLFALSISIKFTTLYSLPVYLLIVALFSFKKSLRLVVNYVGILVMVSGFWYLKNWLLTGSFIFPYELTSNGISLKFEFKHLNQLVQGFSVNRDLINFILIPYHFFFKNVKQLWGIIMFVFYLCSFLYLFFRKHLSDVVLVGITLTKFAIWFFFISHQIRLNYTGLLLIVFMGSYVLSRFKRWALVIVIFSLGIFTLRLPTRSWKEAAVNILPFTVAEIELALGITSHTEFLTNKTGEIYLVTDYINNHKSNSVTVNYWNQIAKYYLKNGNQYISTVPLSAGEYDTFIQAANIEYLAIDLHYRSSYINSNTWDGWWQPRNDFETYLISKSKLVFESPNGWAKLYEINP